MRFALVLLGMLGAAAGGYAQAASCGPVPTIRAELRKAAAAPIMDASDFDHNIAPFRALRDRHPDDLFAHEGYQDAVQRFGIEGHLRALTEEYQNLFNQHPDDLKYHYLYLRSLLGRGTPGAIQGLSEIAGQNPGFAPAHRALAEVYASDAFHDAANEKAERGKFLALCPGAALAQRPGPLPPPTALLDRAEDLLNRNGDPNQAVTLALQGIREEEWRLQRTRPFDWYSVDYKRGVQLEVQAKYWRLWSLEVRSYRKAGQEEKAAQTLATMEQRAAAFRKGADPVYWEALVALTRLYAEGNQKEQATEKLASLQRLLAGQPDAAHASQLQDLRRLVEAK